MYKAMTIAAAVAVAVVPTAAHATDVHHFLQLCSYGTAADAQHPLTMVANGPSFVVFTLPQNINPAVVTCSPRALVLPGQYQISFSGETPNSHFENWSLVREGGELTFVTDRRTYVTDVSADNHHETFTALVFVASPDATS